MRGNPWRKHDRFAGVQIDTRQAAAGERCYHAQRVCVPEPGVRAPPWHVSIINAQGHQRFSLHLLAPLCRCFVITEAEQFILKGLKRKREQAQARAGEDPVKNLFEKAVLSANRFLSEGSEDPLAP